MKKEIRLWLVILNILLLVGSFLCLFKTHRNIERLNEINPSFYDVGTPVISVHLSSGKHVNLHFREANVKVKDAYECKNVEDCYSVVFAIKSYAERNGIEIVRSHTDLVGELRLHQFLYEIGYKPDETEDADLEYIKDRRWYVNIVSQVIGWTGL